MIFLCIYLSEEGGDGDVWEHIAFFKRTDWWMLTKLGRDEVIMALHMRLGFQPDPPRGESSAAQKYVNEGAPSPKDFLFRKECNINKQNASLYPELISQIWQSCFLICYWI